MTITSGGGLGRTVDLAAAAALRSSSPSDISSSLSLSNAPALPALATLSASTLLHSDTTIPVLYYSRFFALHITIAPCILQMRSRHMLNKGQRLERV